MFIFYLPLLASLDPSKTLTTRTHLQISRDLRKGN